MFAVHRLSQDAKMTLLLSKGQYMPLELITMGLYFNIISSLLIVFVLVLTNIIHVHRQNTLRTIAFYRLKK